MCSGTTDARIAPALAELIESFRLPVLKGEDQRVRRQGDRNAHRGRQGQVWRISGFFAPVAHEDSIGGAVADLEDPAQEPLTGVGLNFNLLSDELVGAGRLGHRGERRGRLAAVDRPASREAEVSLAWRRLLAGLALMRSAWRVFCRPGQRSGSRGRRHRGRRRGPSRRH